MFTTPLLRVNVRFLSAVQLESVPHALEFAALQRPYEIAVPIHCWRAVDTSLQGGVSGPTSLHGAVMGVEY
jgi:hypothetical protein